MKAKAKGSDQDVRYEPVDVTVYPEEGVDGEMLFYRFWCRPLFVVYEKYRNGVKQGYLVLPQNKEVFLFDQMVNYAESIKSGQTVCMRQGVQG